MLRVRKRWRCVKGRLKMPGGGRVTCPLVAMRGARWWPWGLPMGWWPPPQPAWSVQGVHPLACQGLGEAHGVAGGLADVRVV